VMHLLWYSENSAKEAVDKINYWKRGKTAVTNNEPLK
jgi:hypothetical protein